MLGFSWGIWYTFLNKGMSYHLSDNKNISFLYIAK